MKPTTSDHLDQTRRSLVSRLKNWDDHESWRQFFDTYWRLIYAVALKAGLTEPEAQDAVQETIISVAKSMAGFKYDPATCSFKTWLQHLARKRVADQFRRRPPAGVAHSAESQTRSGETGRIGRIPEPGSLDSEAIWEEQWRKAAFDAAVANTRDQVAPVDFQIFGFYVLHGWSVEKVAATMGVSAAKIYLAKHRVSRRIKQEVERLEKHGF